MRKSARDHANEDQKRKDQITKLNQADSLIFSTEKNLVDYGDKIPAEKKSTIEGALERLKTVHAAQDGVQVESAMEQLNTAWSAASEDLYRAQQAGDGSAAPGEATPADGSVQDADFEVVDEGDAKA